MDHKRKADDSEGGDKEPVDTPSSDAIVVKRSRSDAEGAIVESKPTSGAIIAAPPGRTSSLKAPIMLLTGHKAEVNTVRFPPSGEFLASAGGDREIFFWNTYGECINYMVLTGHTASILELGWSGDGTKIATASADKTVGIWDVERGMRIKKCREHTSFVNSCSVTRRGTALVASASDDTTARVWDPRMKLSAQTFSHNYPLTSVTWSDAGDMLFTGGLDNIVRAWDMRKGDVVHSFVGHDDTITGLRVSHDGSYLLSNAMDHTVRVWDVRPYAPIDRQLKVFTGCHHGVERSLLRCAWSKDGERVAAGSSDQFVHVWDTTSRRLLYKLPGHAGSVNDVDFHPKEPIIVSCSSDRTIYLGELAA
eukprot:TRINITY_DN3039_c0_g1_i1.p1 TRINITY_DN3039_c0_g1~~TRINITY_DN3039_c0_g1_i1.p1  ORF type:complete len:377 (-),score=81.57 TRINITY_DN3039_c0_g1_i1:13-1104(-)